MNSKFICGILLLLISLPGLASDNKFGADFLQQLTSAEADGVGESIAAYPIGIRSLNNNPAGLTYMEGSELLVNTHEMPRITAVIMKQNEEGEWKDHGIYDIAATEMGLVSYALPLGKFGNLGMSFVLHHAGRFIRVNEEGKALNSFPRNNLAFTIGYSVRIFQGISVGFDVENIRSKVPVGDGDEIGRTNAISVGLMHQMGKRVRVGAVLQNMGSKLSFDSPDIPNKLPRELAVGAVYTVKDSGNSVLSLNVEINPPFDDGPRYNLGAELLYAKFIALRIGYLRSTRDYAESLLNLSDETATNDSRVWTRKGVTFGLGVRFGNVEIDFARAPRREPDPNGDEKLRLDDHDSILSFSAKF